MKISDILSKVDHTYLKQDAVWQDIKRTCDEGALFSCASVCIPPSFVKAAKEYMGEKIKICTVTGFPNGYSTNKVKCFESQEAVRNVINIGDLKCGSYNKVLSDLSDIKKSCEGKLLKVIIETCLLTEYEKIKMCELVTESGADFIKTSTGFSTAGATKDDIILFKRHVGENVLIKAAGGIKTLDDAIDFINLGASRLGTSRIIQIVKKDGFKDESNSSY